MSGEKTEQPTARKKQQARKEGNHAQSPDFAAWGIVLVASFVVPMTLRNTADAAAGVFQQIDEVAANPDPALALKLLGSGAQAGALAFAPLAAVTILIVLAAAAAQGSLKPASKLLMPKFKRLNPATGLKRMVGGHALWELVKALLKTAVLGAVAYLSLRDLVPQLMAAGSLPIASVLTTAGQAAVSLMRWGGAAGLLLAAGDYAMARRRTGKQLRMTKQEVKEEHKRSEGDPHVKGQIRARQAQMSRNRMMAEVPTADVVVVNPTHVAVALRYDPSRGAPRVVAKGADRIAAKIREAAAEHRVPMVQDIPLARSLHAGCEIGQEIPPELYGAVAKVLAFIMALKSKGSAAGTHKMAA
ncbi:EscU/YscU/HrcU family type III secretion system export apparatus switch protein [Actinomadura hibisca]|uniref:EscU/YscU/HrcU family type III secretion system export apparatus switch protein n=1 Tax=Actinomadura hibisca TaxID=68565 RepID=UPI000836AD96|nr:EscU/YscU/HrcU family type III secretion system export apparatus switch protein [Actinomadura hibisca]